MENSTTENSTANVANASAEDCGPDRTCSGPEVDEEVKEQPNEERTTSVSPIIPVAYKQHGVCVRPEPPANLIDTNGNQFVLAEGSLAKKSEARMTKGVNKPRYFVLTSQVLGYYHKSPQAEVDRYGFMRGRCGLPKLRKVSKEGASVALKSITAIQHEDHDANFTLELEDGSKLELVAQSSEAADVWLGALTTWHQYAQAHADVSASSEDKPKHRRRSSIFARFRNKSTDEPSETSKADDTVSDTTSASNEAATTTTTAASSNTASSATTTSTTTTTTENSATSTENCDTSDEHATQSKRSTLIGSISSGIIKSSRKLTHAFVEDEETKEAKRKRDAEKAARKAFLEASKAHEKEQKEQQKRDAEEAAKAAREAAFIALGYRTNAPFDYPKPGRSCPASISAETLKPIEEKEIPGSDLLDAGTAERKSKTYIDAALCHGWLTTVERYMLSGKLERDRYFVLTPTYLAFFANPADAQIDLSYSVHGKASGKSVNKLTHTGAKIPLESIVDMTIVRKQENVETVVDDSIMDTTADADSHSTDESDEDDDDVSDHEINTKESNENKEEKENKESNETDENKAENKEEKVENDNKEEKENKGQEATEKTESDTSAVENFTEKPTKSKRTVWITRAVETNMIRLDLGDETLTVDTHNQRNRDTWLTALKTWRKRHREVLDNATLDAFGELAHYRMYSQVTDKSKSPARRGTKGRSSLPGAANGSPSKFGGSSIMR